MTKRAGTRAFVGCPNDCGNAVELASESAAFSKQSRPSRSDAAAFPCPPAAADQGAGDQHRGTHRRAGQARQARAGAEAAAAAGTTQPPAQGPAKTRQPGHRLGAGTSQPITATPPRQSPLSERAFFCGQRLNEPDPFVLGVDRYQLHVRRCLQCLQVRRTVLVINERSGPVHTPVGDMVPIIRRGADTCGGLRITNLPYMASSALGISQQQNAHVSPTA